MATRNLPQGRCCYCPWAEVGFDLWRGSLASQALQLLQRVSHFTPSLCLNKDIFWSHLSFSIKLYWETAYFIVAKTQKQSYAHITPFFLFLLAKAAPAMTLKCLVALMSIVAISESVHRDSPPCMWSREAKVFYNFDSLSAPMMRNRHRSNHDVIDDW